MINEVYKASITREPFLFYEMRTTAKLMAVGLDDDAVINEIVENNLFQYPTVKSVRRMAGACVLRLKNMNDESLILAIANESSDVAKQVCLYAMMKQSKLITDFMITVVGEKYRIKDTSFGRMDLNVFFMRLQEQNDTVATWSESTITKLKQVIIKILVENEYLDNIKSEQLNPVWLFPILENAIKANGDKDMLPAFNCFM